MLEALGTKYCNVQMEEVMDDLIDKLNNDLEPKSTEALIEAVNKILVSYQHFHELTTGSMLSDDTQRQRKTLLTTSLFALIVTWAGVFPTKISWLGIELTNANTAVIYAGLSLVLSYLFRSFWWRADLEFSNSRIKRQNANLLHQLETLAAINNLKKIDNELAELLSTEVSSLMLSDNKNDPYRASIMGLNFKSRFFELWLPHNIFVISTLSCVYFTLRSLSV